MSNGSLFLNGEWINGGGDEFVSTNPASEDICWSGRSANAQNVHDAIMSARAAFTQWSGLSFTDRSSIVLSIADKLNQQKQLFAKAISEETGKPLWESEFEVSAMVAKFKISIAAYEDRCREITFAFGAGKSIRRFKAHGVMGVFGPFNLPGHLPNGHIIPALLAGNTIVFKPSELTPNVGQMYAKLFEDAAIAPGVFNLVQGARVTGEAIVNHDEINGILFTGSYATGKNIHQSLAGKPEKILALEMGGNNPLIVFDAKDIQASVYLIIQSAFITSGQRCVCARRLILPQNEFGQKVLSSLIDMTKRIRIGKFDDALTPFMGPLIHAASAERILKCQSQLEQQGGKVLLKAVACGPTAAFLSPGIIDVTEIKERDDGEIFGPLLQVIFVEDFEQAIAEANNTRFGLAAGLISDDELLFQRFLLRSRAGIVNFNRQITGASSQQPFGGSGLSGNHRPSAYFAADYCAYPIAVIEEPSATIPEQLPPGIILEE